MGYPLFQNALTSTPFSGTLADTSTPTPAGEVPQAPVATEMPGTAGNNERIRKIVESLDLLEKTFKQVAEAKPAPSQVSWQRRLRLAMHGVSPDDDTGAMYLKAKVLGELSGRMKELEEELRLQSRPSPQEAQAQKEAADRERRAGEMNWYDRFRRSNTALPEIPIHKQEQYIESGYGLGVDEHGGPEDLLKKITGPAKAGADFGKGIVGLLPKEDQAAATVGAINAERERALRTKAEADDKKYGGYKTLAQLKSATQGDYDRILRNMPETGTEKKVFSDPIDGPKLFDVPAHSEADAKEARRRVAAANPALLKWIPDYVEQGDAARSVEDAPPPQGDVSFEKKIAERKAKLAKAK